MQITIDLDEQLLYIKIKDEKIHETKEIDKKNEVLADFDRSGELVGLEFLDPFKLTVKELEKFERKYGILHLSDRIKTKPIKELTHV